MSVHTMPIGGISSCYRIHRSKRRRTPLVTIVRKYPGQPHVPPPTSPPPTANITYSLQELILQETCIQQPRSTTLFLYKSSVQLTYRFYGCPFTKLLPFTGTSTNLYLNSREKLIFSIAIKHIN